MSGFPQTEKQLDISIRSRNDVVFAGKIWTLTSYNDTGEFDVLPQHANFVTLIKDVIILNKSRQDEKKIEVKSGGLMNVEQDRIDVYLGI